MTNNYYVKDEYVKHLKGSGVCCPCKGGSCIMYYRGYLHDAKNKRYPCANFDCTTEEEDFVIHGAHVTDKHGRIYLVPTCRYCNKPGSGEEFLLLPGTIKVPVSCIDGCIPIQA